MYTHLSTTAVRPFQHCFTVSWWVDSWISVELRWDSCIFKCEPCTCALSVVARRQIEVATWRPGAGICTIWNELHRTRLAFRRPGAGAHRDIERGKVPSAARVACIARSACTSLFRPDEKRPDFIHHGPIIFGSDMSERFDFVHYGHLAFRLK